MTEERLAARLTAVWVTPILVRDQADPAIPARPEALLRRPRHRRPALRQRPAGPRAESAAIGAAGQCRQEDGTNRTRGQVDKRKGGQKTLASRPPLRLSTCPLVYLFTPALLPLFTPALLPPSSFFSLEPSLSLLFFSSLPLSITSVSGMIFSSTFV